MKNASFKFLAACSITILLLSYAFTAAAFSDPRVMAVFNMIMLIPAPTAALFLYLQERSFKQVLRPIFHRLSWQGLAFGILYPVGVIFGAALLARVLGLATIEWRELSSIRFPTLVQFAWGITFVLGEEYAWRGYLFPGFVKIWGPVRAAATTGLLWSIWHGPLVYGLAVSNHMDSPLMMTLILMAAVFVFGFSFGYAYLLSESVIPSVIFHYVWNWINPVVLGNLYRNRPGITKGNIVLINGEGIFGILFGLAFMACYIWKFRDGKKAS